jgi:2-polyprenyl-3-methyl-5-hydroxy-6-metoxy-1,4-benzoquinol methylase
MLTGCSGEEAGSKAPSSQASDVSTVVAAAEWKAVIDDWYVDGTFDEQHRCVAIHEAIKRLPTSPPEYLSVYEDIHRLERRACP